MSNKNVLTYAMRNAEKIVWDKTVSGDGLTTVYVSKAPVYVPFGKYSNEIIGDANTTLTIVKSSVSDKIISQQISNSVIFYDNTPIKGESIIVSNINKLPIIQKLLGSTNKYNIFFQNETTIDGQADFIDSLGNFSNWTGTAVVEYKDNEKYFAVTYKRYVGASPDTKIEPLFEIENFSDLEWVETSKTDSIKTFETKKVKLIVPNSTESSITSLIAEIRTPTSSSFKNSTVYSLSINANFPKGNNGKGAYLKTRLFTVSFSAQLILLGGKTYKIIWNEDKNFIGFGSRDAFLSNYLLPLNDTATVSASLVKKNLAVTEQFGVDLLKK